MARKAMVTRTIESTKCVVLCLDTVTCEPCNKVVELPRTYKNEEALMRKVRKAIETEDLKAVKIVSTEKVEECTVWQKLTSLLTQSSLTLKLVKH